MRHVTAPLAPNVVKRSRVLALLDRAQETPVTLVCGPAGYGKSLLVASWLAERADDHWAWVDLLSVRRTAAQFWATMIRGLRTTVDGPDRELDAIDALALHSPQDVPARLAQWISQHDHHTHLVIDELHTVADLGVHEQLVELVASAASRLRLVVITRHDPLWPLHRMRLDGLLRDVRADALAFDEAETEELFALLELPVGTDRIHGVVVTTQGWAAGVRLAALGAASAADPGEYLDSISGRDQYIADYLLREVYDGLGADWQSFLARISVVDAICPALASALGAGQDSEDRLAELTRQNVFIHQLGDQLCWYRVHPLLLDFLRSRVTDEAERRVLHGRAARWFQSQDEPWTALTHALSAHDWELAADLSGTHVVSWTVCQPPEEFEQQLSRVPREAILTQPGLAIGLAAALGMRGEAHDVPELLAAAEAHLGQATGLRHVRYEFLLDLIDICTKRWSGDLETVLAGCRRIPTDPAFLGSIGMADWLAIRTLLFSNAGTAQLWTGDTDAARESLSEAARVDTFRRVGLPTVNARAHLAYLHWDRGELNEAERIGRSALDEAVRMGVPSALQATGAYLALAGVAIDRVDLFGADRWLELARGSSREPQTTFAADLMAVRLLAARGCLFEALHTLRVARERQATVPLASHLIERSLRLEAVLLQRAGHGRDVRKVWESVPPRPDQHDPADVRAHVDRLLAATRRAAAEDAVPEALEELEAALRCAAPQRLREPFLALGPLMSKLISSRIELGTVNPEFAADLLGRTTAHERIPRSKDVLVPLTARELNILRYLATTLTAQEIAQTLYVSINTVKTHQRAIHQKLGASDRRQAVARARSLGLL